MSIRYFLLIIRRQYNKEFNKWLIIYGSVFALSMLSAILVDIFVPFNTLTMVLRLPILLLLVASEFALLYFLSLVAHDYQKDKNRDWLPIRYRFSYRTRIAMSIVVLAFALIFALGNSKNATYTIVASLSCVTILALIAFIRRTSAEQKLADYGITDPRDREMNKTIDEQREAFKNMTPAKMRARRKEQRKKRKAARKLVK